MVIPKNKKILITLWIYLPCGECCNKSEKGKRQNSKRRVIKRKSIFDDSNGQYITTKSRNKFGKLAFEWSEVHGTEYDKDLGCLEIGCPQSYKPDIRID